MSTAARGRTLVPTLLSVLIANVLAGAPALAQNANLDDQQGGVRTIPLVDGSNVRIDPVTGDISMKPQADTPAWQACLGEGGSGTCQVDIGGTFVSSDSSVTKGATFTVSWDARGAWDCAGTMETADGVSVTSTAWDDTTTRKPRDSASIETSTLEPGDYVAILTCANGPSADVSSLAFTVTDSNPDAPAFCSDEGRVPPSSVTRDIAIQLGSSAETVNWEQFFNDLFPFGNTNKMEIVQDRYGALAFDSTGVASGTKGNIAFEDPQTAGDTVTNGNKLITISECPGDFTDPADSTSTTRDPACRWYGGNGNFRYTVADGDFGDARCSIEQGKTYFLNVLYTADCTVDSLTGNFECADVLTWECTGSSDRCGNNVDHLEGN